MALQVFRLATAALAGGIGMFVSDGLDLQTSNSNGADVWYQKKSTGCLGCNEELYGIASDAGSHC